jgi:RHS repeat-associated protein
VSFLLTDRLGSVRNLVSNTGVVLDQINYDAWGNIISQTNPEQGLPLGYNGYWYDSLVGMYQVNHRWYDPQAGRWDSEDPTGFTAGDSNLYRYVANDPTNATDPTGEYEIDVHFYLTYFLARAAGLSAADAFEIALADQFVDEHPASNPIPSITKKSDIAALQARLGKYGAVIDDNGMPVKGLLDKHLSDEMRKRLYLHFRTRTFTGTVKPGQGGAVDIVDLAIKSKNNILMGIGLHAYQDSWSHQDYNFLAGHLFAGHRPDQPDNVFRGIPLKSPQEIAKDMALQSYKRLVDYANAKGVKGPLLSEKQVQAILNTIMDVYVRSRVKTPFAAWQKRAKERSTIVQLLVWALSDFEISIPDFPEDAVTSPLQYEKDRLKGLFLQALGMVPSPIE